MKEKRSVTLKKRYQVYRKLGYDSATSHALSQRALDVSSLEISEKTGKLKKNSKTKVFITTEMKAWERRKAVDNYTEKTQTIQNDTVYTRHGMLVRDKRYKGETGRTVSIIKHENHLSTNQAYYFFYFMTRYNLTYKEAKAQLLSNKEFEMYDKNKKGR